jgi:hypothetical protein
MVGSYTIFKYQKYMNLIPYPSTVQLKTSNSEGQSKSATPAPASSSMPQPSQAGPNDGSD